jgi:hypothetical protein
MVKRAATIAVLSMLAVAGLPAQIAAHGPETPAQFAGPIACSEPLKPIVFGHEDSDPEGELRQEYELYFKEVEAYLNCLNAEAHRVHAEAQQAANEYSRVLDRTPPPPWKAQPDPILVPIEPMVTSGTLNLDFRGSGG